MLSSQIVIYYRNVSKRCIFAWYFDHYKSLQALFKNGYPPRDIPFFLTSSPSGRQYIARSENIKQIALHERVCAYFRRPTYMGSTTVLLKRSKDQMSSRVFYVVKKGRLYVRTLNRIYLLSIS